MKKFIVETYYTCTFKTVHRLDNLNDQEMSKIDGRTDGEVEVIDVKLNNRKTKKIGDKKKTPEKKKTQKMFYQHQCLKNCQNKVKRVLMISIRP